MHPFHPQSSPIESPHTPRLLHHSIYDTFDRISPRSNRNRLGNSPWDRHVLSPESSSNLHNFSFRNRSPSVSLVERRQQQQHGSPSTVTSSTPELTSDKWAGYSQSSVGSFRRRSSLAQSPLSAFPVNTPHTTPTRFTAESPFNGSKYTPLSLDRQKPRRTSLSKPYTSLPRKKYPSTYGKAVQWPPPGFACFLESPTAKDQRRRSVIGLGVDRKVEGLLEPYSPSPRRTAGPACFDRLGREPELRRASIAGGLTPATSQELQSRQRILEEEQDSLGLTRRIERIRSVDKQNPIGQTRRPSLQGWKEPFVTIRTPVYRPHKTHDEETLGNMPHKFEFAESNFRDMPSTFQVSAKRRASDMDVDDDHNQYYRRPSEIGPLDMDKTAAGDSYVRPGPTPYQNRLPSLSMQYLDARQSRLRGWVGSQSTNDVGSLPEINDNSPGPSNEGDHRVSLPGIQALLGLADAPRSDSQSKQRNPEGLSLASWRVGPCSPDEQQLVTSPESQGVKTGSDSFHFSQGSTSRTSSLFSSSNMRDSIGSMSIMTPGSKSFDFPFSNERDGRLSASRQGSSASVMQTIEKRTSGLELEDISTPVHENGPINAEPTVWGSGSGRHSLPTDQIPPSRSRQSSMLDVKGMLDGPCSFRGFDEDGPRPYTMPAPQSWSINSPPQPAGRRLPNADCSDSKRRKGSLEETDGKSRVNADHVIRLPRRESDPLDLLRRTSDGNLRIPEDECGADRRINRVVRPSLPSIRTMTSFSSMRSTISTNSPSETPDTRSPVAFRDYSLSNTSARPTPLSSHRMLFESAEQDYFRPGPPSRYPSSLVGTDNTPIDSPAHQGDRLLGMKPFNSSRASPPGNKKLTHRMSSQNMSNEHSPNHDGRRSSLSVSNLEATATLGIPHGVVLTQSSTEAIDKEKANVPTVGPRYGCDFCGKTFSRPSSLKIHIYTHTGEKPYVCHWPHCNRQFSVQSNLKRHAKVHYDTAAETPNVDGESSSSPTESPTESQSQKKSKEERNLDERNNRARVAADTRSE